MSEFTLLRLIALKGRTSPEAAAASLGEPGESVAAAAGALVDQGLVTETKLGLRITEAGRARVAEYVAAEREAVDAAAVDEVYERFCALNGDLKEIVTAWQLKDPETPNDHGDPDYDAAVVARLSALHERARPVAAALAALSPRFATYGRRLDEADRRIAGGDHSYLARPVIDSYHTVWFELHEDLIGLAGRTRAEEAVAGRGA